MRKRVVIVGGGFAGLAVAKSLRRTPVDVVLIDRRNFHLFQPLLYQVASGMLSPANIAAPLRVVLRRQNNVSVLMDEVIDFDPGNRRVILSRGEISYDTLVVAAGSRYNYFGHDQWQTYAPSLKTIEDATEIRRRILSALEVAERENDPLIRRDLLSWVIVGGGPTGVELAGTLAELTRRTFRDDFRRISPAESSIYLIEGGTHLLSSFPRHLSDKARSALEDLGIEVRTECIVTDVRPGGVTVRTGDQTMELRARTVLWTAGVRASPLCEKLAAATGASTDRIGRIVVADDLSIAGYPDVFAIGDMAHVVDASGTPLPGVAPVALQQGKYVGKLIGQRLRGDSTAKFHYNDQGMLATIGRKRAVADLHWVRMSGFPAWILWLFVHLMQIVSFQNRVLVFLQWAWNFVTFNRSACLITGESGQSADDRGAPKGPPQESGTQAEAYRP